MEVRFCEKREETSIQTQALQGECSPSGGLLLHSPVRVSGSGVGAGKGQKLSQKHVLQGLL